MATQNRIPSLGFGASIAAVVLLGFGGTPVEQIGIPDYVVQLPTDQVVVQLPADTYVVQAPADDQSVTL